MAPKAGEILLVTALVLAGSEGRADPPASTPADTSKRARSTGLDAQMLAGLALEHARARDALLAAEARMALLMDKVFRSRLVVRYQGEMERPFELAWLELDIDGALAYRKEFNKAPSILALKLFDGHLPPGRHVLRLRIYGRGPDDPPGALPGYYAGCGMTVHLREKATTEALFEADQEGGTEGAVVRDEEPQGDWTVEIAASFETITP